MSNFSYLSTRPEYSLFASAAIEAENAAMKTDLKGEPPHDENF